MHFKSNKEKKSLNKRQSKNNPGSKKGTYGPMKSVDAKKQSNSIAELPNYNNERKRKLDNDRDRDGGAKKPKMFKQQTSSQKKQKKLKRRYQDSDLLQLSVNAKKVWEELRCRSCPKDKKAELSSQLLDLMKENLSKFMHAHDTVRIVESLLANGDSNVRDVIFKCLKDQIVDMSKNVYSSFLIQKMIKYGSKEQKAEIVDSFKGEVVNLMKHKIGAKVIEYLYNEYANAHQRGFLIQEFYSHEFRVFKDDKVIDLKSALLKYPSKQAQIIENLKTTLLDMINKGIVQPSIFHTLLKEYLGEAPPGDKAVMIESSRELLVTMVHTRDGSRAAMHSLWYGTSKDRKIILKTFKTHIKSIACNEHGYLVLLAIFDCVDDTVMVFKTIFQELKEALSEVLDNDNGRKVLLYLVAPRDSRFFHPDVVNILKHGDGNVHSKKDATVRWQELLSSVIQPLLTEIEESLDTLILNPKIAILLGVCLEACKDSDMRKHLLAKLASVVTKSQGVIEGPGVQMIIKKVIALDKNIEDKKETFSYHVLEGLSDQLMESWLGCNRGCFCLISMSECGNPEIVTLVSKKLSKFQEVLNCLSHKGAEILKSKLVK